MAMSLNVIEFEDPSNRSVVKRIPESGAGEIPYGAQLIVRQNQEAVFFRDGKAMDLLGPGRHTLSSANIPVLTKLLTLPWKKSPFRALVYFIGKQTFVDQKWGTKQPIVFHDESLGLVRLRSFGKYSFRVTDSTVLINALLGTQGLYTTDDVTHHLRDVIIARMNDLLGTMRLNLVELPAKFDEIAAATRAKVADEFAKFGLELVDFYISAITPTDDVQKLIDEKFGEWKTPSLEETTAATIRASDANRQRAARTKADVQAIVKAVASENNWTIQDSDGGFQITVPIGPLRRQIVAASFDRSDSTGSDVMSLVSQCGPASEETAMSMLRYNRQLIHAAFALEETDSGPQWVLVANQLIETADDLEVRRAITAVAWQADQIEQQLSGGRDQL